MLDGNVNIREEPNLNSKILGKLQRDDKVALIGEQDWMPYEINGFESWRYKIQYNNIIGYVWGQYIADNRLLHTTDGNEIIVYFRLSDYSPGIGINADNDIFVFFNSKEIFLPKTGKNWNRYFKKVTGDGLYLAFTNMGTHIFSMDEIWLFHEYLITKNGQIVFKEYPKMTRTGFRNLEFEEINNW
jgi:hypothetical protein